jgi:hypothetical protein
MAPKVPAQKWSNDSTRWHRTTTKGGSLGRFRHTCHRKQNKKVFVQHSLQYSGDHASCVHVLATNHRGLSVIFEVVKGEEPIRIKCLTNVSGQAFPNNEILEFETSKPQR